MQRLAAGDPSSWVVEAAGGLGGGLRGWVRVSAGGRKTKERVSGVVAGSAPVEICCCKNVWIAESSTVFPGAGVVSVMVPMSEPWAIFWPGTLYSAS